jgi:DNA mismatch repair protein MSH6
MGGKSTLLRSTCVAVIMAQLGCHVAASSAVLEPVDAIFTRIGEMVWAVPAVLCVFEKRL